MNKQKQTNQKQWPPVGVDWYYADDYVCIAHGDCREILPSLPKVDLVLTDPPYGIGINHNIGRRHGDRHSLYDKCNWDSTPPDSKCFDMLFSASTFQVIFGANHFITKMPYDSPCWLAWDKGFSESLSFAMVELAWTSFSFTCKIFRKTSANTARQHPTQKPLSLMTWCIELCPNEPQTILDPFMGSGTTLRAAKDLGRKAIGIELEEKYCEIAAKRMAQEVLPLWGEK